MAHLLVVILDDIERIPHLLQAWQSIGVPGVTILESAGGYRTHTWLSKVGLGAIDRLFESDEVRRRTLLASIEQDELLERAVAEAEHIVGGFDRPDSGVLLVLPVSHARGLSKRPTSLPEKTPVPIVQPRWRIQRDTPVEQVTAILDLEPTIVGTETPLDGVAQAMLARPNTHVACVVDQDGLLVGLLSLRQLADDLFFHIFPEEFFSEVTDLEHALQFADKSRMRCAADAMQEPILVKRGDPVKEAFKRLHENDLPGLPVVDERYRVVGYINLLELLAVCLETEIEETTQ